MIAENQLRTGAWDGDYPLKLDFPAEWDVTFMSPRTPAPSLQNCAREAKL